MAHDQTPSLEFHLVLYWFSQHKKKETTLSDDC